MTARSHARSGALLLAETAEALPLVHFSVSLRTGSAGDPAELPGLTRMTGRMLRMGTAKMRATTVENRLDAMGAQLSIGVGVAYTHISCVVVERNVDELFELVANLLRAPAFRAADLRRLKEETLAGMEAAFDDDATLAGRHFRAFTLPEHVYGRSSVGTPESLEALDVEMLRKHHARIVTGPNVIVASAGRLDMPRLSGLVERHLGWLSKRHVALDAISEPKLPRGRRVRVVDKPERTQTQLLIGTLGTRARDADHTALLVADTAFGGLFTSRLTNEVRAKRGYSYGASSGFGQQRTRDLWSMRTAPSAQDAVACLSLQLALYDDYVARGLSAGELSTARSYLRKSVAFQGDTAAKRVDHGVDTELFDLPRNYHAGFGERVAKVTRAQANAAVKKRMSARDLSIVMVATAKDLVPQLEKLDGISQIEVVPFDEFP